MAYTGYEIDSDNVIGLVQAHCRHLTDDGEFSASTIPPLETVELWITETYHDLNATLAAAGYTIPVTDAEAVGFLERLNVFGAVLQVELSHPISGRRGRENDRYRTYASQYNTGKKLILDTDALSALGADVTTALSAYVDVGGRSRDRKEQLYAEVDAIQSRFKRDFHRDPRTTSGGGQRLDNVG